LTYRRWSFCGLARLTNRFGNSNSVGVAGYGKNESARTYNGLPSIDHPVCVCVFFPGLLNRAIINTGCTRSTALSIRPAFRPTTLQRLFASFYYQFIPATQQQLAYNPIFPKDIVAVEVFDFLIKKIFFFENFLRHRSNDGFGSDWTVLSVHLTTTSQPIRRHRTVPNDFTQITQKPTENFSKNSISTFVLRTESTTKIIIMCGGGPKLDPTGLY